MAKYYFTKKDGTKEAISLEELKVKLYAGEIEPSDVDFKSLIGASPKDKKELEQALDAVVQITNKRKKAAEEAIAEDAKKLADEKVKNAEVSKLQKKLETATAKAQFDNAEFADAKAMLDADPSNKDKVEFYASCRKQVYDDYVEIYKTEGEIRKKENPDDSTIEDSIKRRIKGLELKLGISSSTSVDPLTPTPSTTATTTTASTRSSVVLEPYKKPNGEVVNTVLTYNGEPISENDLKSALKRFGATINDVAVCEASEYMGQILVGDEVTVLSAFRRKKLS